MDWVNIRKLKNNPSEALRNAEKGPVLVLKGDTPDALILHLGLGESSDDADVRLALATALFRAGTLSLGRAARVAETEIPELVTHLSRLGIPVVEGDRDEVESDLETLTEWLASS